MSALKIEQLTPGTTAFIIDSNGVVQESKVVSVKTRSGVKPQVCIETATDLLIAEFYPERFYSSSKDGWYAVAMLNQRRASEAMAAADNAFKKAGIAVGDDTPAPPAQ